MAISVVDTAAVNTKVNTNITIPYPTGATSGDYCVVHIYSANDGASGRVTPTGWSELVYRGVTSPPYVALMYGRLLDGTEGSSETFAVGELNLRGYMIALRGVDQATPTSAWIEDIRNVGQQQWFATPDAPAAGTDGSLGLACCTVSNLDDGDGVNPSFHESNGWTLGGFELGNDVYPQGSAMWGIRTLDVADGQVQTFEPDSGVTNSRFVMTAGTFKPAAGTSGGTATIGGVTYNVTKGDGTSLTVAKGDGTTLG